MTNPNGKMFVSYRRTKADIAEALIRSLQTHGIRTWQDISDLRTEPTQAEIKQVLEEDDSELAGGIVLVSKDVAKSEIILNLELPGLHDRWKNDDEFFVVVALCPGVDYDEAGDILAQAPTLLDFSGWNMIKLESEADTPSAADDVATAVLTERVRIAHDQLEKGQPLDCAINTYGSPSYATQPPVALDWSSYFEDSPPAPNVWNQRLIPKLRTVIDLVEQAAPGRPLHIRGQARIPAVFALGRCLRTTRGVESAWQKENSGQSERWNIHDEEQESGLISDLNVRDVTRSDLAVLVSVTNDVEPAVGRTKSTLPNFGGVLELSLDDDIGSQLNGSEAVHAAHVFRRAIQSALNELSATSTIHLFMAVPAGLAFFFGQQSNTFPQIQTYLLESSNGARTYYPAALLDGE